MEHNESKTLTLKCNQCKATGRPSVSITDDVKKGDIWCECDRDIDGESCDGNVMVVDVNMN